MSERQYKEIKKALYHAEATMRLSLQLNAVFLMLVIFLLLALGN